MNRKKQQWIEVGYEQIAFLGFESVGVELISREMKKSKSSFYNYFGDYENYIEELLTHQISRNKNFVSKLAEINSLMPDLINLLIEFKSDIFFHKQLYKHRDKKHFKETLDISFNNYSNTIEEKWVDYFGLSKNRAFIQRFHRYIAEHFLMMINNDNYTFEWMENYLIQLKSMLGLLLNQIKK